MIPKHIDKDKSGDKIKHDYRFLALYIWDAKNDGEKTLYRWLDGCQAENFHSAIMEVEATQALNTRSEKTKTYHLTVSFRPEDEAGLTKDILRDIENQLAASLGFQEHQRFCGVHKDTNNLHLHVAYNMINHRSFNRHEPFRDYNKLLETCRKIEKQYNLTIDPGIENGVRSKISAKARDMEARTGLESFESYVKRHADALLTLKNVAGNWRQLHEGLAAYGLSIKPRGNGLVIGSSDKNFVKASAVDRAFSKNALTKVLGSYEEYRDSGKVELKDTYKSVPLSRSKSWPARDALFEAYSGLKEQKKKELDILTGKFKLAEVRIKAKWAQKKTELELVPMRRDDRQKLLHLMLLNEKDEIRQYRQKITDGKNAIRKRFPYSNWREYLQGEAGKGNETALKVLRVCKNTEPKASVYCSDKWEEINRKIAHSNSKERQIIETAGISCGDRKALLSLNKMEQVLGLENFKYRLDLNGTAIFYLSSGGTIRDTGKEIFFSRFDKNAVEIAVKFAEVKWGQNIKIEGNSIAFVKMSLER